MLTSISLGHGAYRLYRGPPAHRMKLLSPAGSPAELVHQLDTLSALFSALFCLRVNESSREHDRTQRGGKEKRRGHEGRGQPVKVTFYTGIPGINILLPAYRSRGNAFIGPGIRTNGSRRFHSPTFTPGYAEHRLLATKPLKGTDRVRSRVP